MRVSFHLFRYFGKRGCDTTSAMKHERSSLHDVVQQCRKVLMWNQNTDKKSLMPGWPVFYGLRNDSPANACCRRCASLQKQECAALYRYCRGLEMTLCTWARLYVGKFSDMLNMNIYFHCFIYSLWSGSHLTTWTEIRWPWVAPTWYLSWLQYQSRYFGSTTLCLGKLVDH